jgi:hypothetical protein
VPVPALAQIWKFALRATLAFTGGRSLGKFGKKMRLLLLCSVFFVPLANLTLGESSAVPEDELFRSELKSIAGTGRPISAENNGFKAPESVLKGTRWIRDVAGNWVIQRGDEIVVEWAVRKINATGSITGRTARERGQNNLF